MCRLCGRQKLKTNCKGMRELWLQVASVAQLRTGQHFLSFVVPGQAVTGYHDYINMLSHQATVIVWLVSCIDHRSTQLPPCSGGHAQL